eukprot:scaffold2473_cov104-Skeletonema_dohrnii-CCMP3373.AAC.6
MDNLVTALAAATDGDEQGDLVPPPAKKARTSRSKKGGDIPREKRLEQNRKAAIESRRRKKVMVSCLGHWAVGTASPTADDDIGYGCALQRCLFAFLFLLLTHDMSVVIFNPCVGR